ncbi:alpha/beta family hydrolase [Nitzschia inconspicua]|uniref:Alpha/beta family hydrolase n=1 Tax=Nitzschia inconspicua TaxID=303405 RepID=A0A9K3PI40_9STRA|nr:alpha/beta family hydrolase [Nitzschia inconspicua]
MPFLSRPCGARIYYETKGHRVTGIPVLLLAPGGMRSSITKWEMSPYNPWKELNTADNNAGDSIDHRNDSRGAHFYLIGMDQRFANRSTATLQNGDGWHTFLQDQLAILDELNIQKCHLLGSCIGPSYAFRLMKCSPERFGRCVMLQPIGLTKHTTEQGESWEGLNKDASWRWVGDWADEMVRTRKCQDPNLLRALHDEMFLQHDFVFSVTRQDVAKLSHPMLVFMGNDIFHPSETSREIARIAPNAELVQLWRDEGREKLQKAKEKIERFLSTNLQQNNGS